MKRELIHKGQLKIENYGHISVNFQRIMPRYAMEQLLDHIAVAFDKWCDEIIVAEYKNNKKPTDRMVKSEDKRLEGIREVTTARPLTL